MTDQTPLNDNVVPLRGGSANGSGGPPPPKRRPCDWCTDPLVEQDDGRAFHLDGSPACRVASDAYPRKPVGWQPPTRTGAP